MTRRSGWRITVDTGGTFTDVVVTDGAHRLTIGKALTTPERIFDGMHAALETVACEAGLAVPELLRRAATLIYGTTRATNAIVTGQTAFAELGDGYGLAEGGIGMGSGRYRGAPAAELVYGPRDLPMTVVFAADGQVHPPRGVRGGHDGNRGATWLRDRGGRETRLANVGQFELSPGEWLRGVHVAGAGYGDALERDPAHVAEDVLEGYVSEAHARDVYGVVFKTPAADDQIEPDAEATAARRRALRSPD